MSKRYYISPIIGDGSEDNPFRPAVEDYGLSCVHVPIPVDMTTGQPLVTWGMSMVSANNHSAILADQAIDALPDFPLDGKVSAIHTATKNALIAKLQARGIDTSFIGTSDGYRDVVRGIGRVLNPLFDENDFDVV